RGRASEVAVTARAAASALLARLVPALMGPGESDVRRKAVDGLFTAAAAEPHEGLRRVMVTNLATLPDRALLAKERATRDGLLAEVLHEAAPRDVWFGDDPKPTLRVFVSVMDEFWKDELQTYRDQGYTVRLDGETAARATKKVEDDQGRTVTISVELRQSNDEVFDPMADPKTHVVLYSGHAQLGGVAKIALEHGPRAEAGPKVLGLFACRGKQNLPAIERRFPSAHVMVAEKGTYPEDDHVVMHHLLEGIATGKTYGDIEAAALREGIWEKKNYVFPNEAVRLGMVDPANAGRLMGRDRDTPLVFSPKLRDPGAKSITMKPLARPPALETIPGDRVVDALSWFQTIHAYWSEGDGNRADRARADRFVAGGWFESRDPAEIVRVEERRGDGGKPVVEVKVNSAYAHQTPDALAMMVTFDLAKKTFDRTRPDEPESDKRMRALAMVATYTYYLVEYSDVADALLRRFAERFDFPPTLTWPVAERAVAADAHGDASAKVMRQLELGMEFPFLEVNPARTDREFRRSVGEALDLLRDAKTPVARATYEAVTSGRVKIDELADLTVADFKRARNEFARDGVDLPIEDAVRLHDGRVSSMRTLRDAINGYQWDDRIYVARGMEPRRLAQTIAHEVSHVLNASEEHYRGPKQILLEEYRAWLVEHLVFDPKPTAAECRRIKAGVIRDYGLEGVTPDDVPDLPPGVYA
ncbi:hypothetical protein L6R52_38685, partial [Myxococcota bacterium]|nr:hypothetical protein [Myxococcota bacterium]